MDVPPVRAGTMWAACRACLMPTIRLDATGRFRLPGFARSGDYRGSVTRSIQLDDATTRRLERHETMAHAIPSRIVRDLGDALVLHDPRDPDPFWNRMVSVRWPDEPAAFDHRLDEAIAMFALDAARRTSGRRRPTTRPPTSPARLQAAGFRDVGGGHVMVLADPAACPAARGPTSSAAGVEVQRHLPPDGRGGRRRRRHRQRCSRSRSGRCRIGPASSPTTCGARSTTRGSRWPWSGWTASRRRSRRRPRSTGSPTSPRSGRAPRGAVAVSAGLATRHAVAIGGGGSARIVYLGVFTGNAPAIRLYERLGFASGGEAPDLLLG